MKTRRAALATGLAVLPLALAAPASAADTVNFTLDELNNSGASSQATVTANDDGSLHVVLQGSGFVPGQPHAQHIHGDDSGKKFVCPTASADANGDGIITTVEGLPSYGGVFLSLTTKGDTSPDSGLAVDRMPVADANGTINYDRTIPADQVPSGVIDNLSQLHIVQHGIDVNGNDKYDVDALGISQFAKSLGVSGIPEEATDPATCGEVTPAGAVETGAGSTQGTEELPLFALGGTALVGAVGAFAARRRLRSSATA